ncbi:hypothetical protein [Propionibacterium freudenreichii]|uniref:hypothetical protein n=1 Tax=Propionibacterium freudenreichii TaxID=1744 RepID=UPI000AA79899|nr:hypothetical protein [Propionibacterium freudenreichii]SBW75831.1 Hypothetical protein PFR_JS22-1_183 [Propionibacterium freudenreichii]
MLARKVSAICGSIEPKTIGPEKGRSQNMRFSEQHQITRDNSEDWFDANVEMDSPLYVDPFLIFEDESVEWAPAHEELIAFFDATLDMLALAEGDKRSMHWEKAERFLLFPEPKEFALGLSMGHPVGSGIGPDLARDMCEGLEFFRLNGRGSDERLLAKLAVLVPGMGVDRISDMVCNILKERFITYTQGICNSLGVPMTEFSVPNARWTGKNCRWSSARTALPASPTFKGGVILTPERFLKDIPRVTAEGFWNWAEANEAQSLRWELNYDLAKSLSRSDKAQRGRELAHRDIDMLERYVAQAAAEVSPYDVSQDPRGIVRWEEAGREIARASFAPEAPETQGDFEDWLLALAESFKRAVEDNGLWRALWNDGYTKHRPENIAQVIARSTWIEHCRSRNVDLSREADCGRGPVDFKFSRGWQMRGLLEVKHISSGQFVHGAETQLPVYLKGEKASFGIYLCIGYADKDFTDERLGLVRDVCTAITKAGKTRIVPVFVDARPKLSASKA